MGCLSSHLFVHTLCLSSRMELRRSPARPPGGRCLGRKTFGAWPPTPPRPCLLTSVPQPSPRPPLPWERFRVMVSLTRDLWHLRSHIHICSAPLSPGGASQFRRCVKTCYSIWHYSHEEHARNQGKRLQGQLWSGATTLQIINEPRVYILISWKWALNRNICFQPAYSECYVSRCKCKCKTRVTCAEQLAVFMVLCH